MNDRLEFATQQEAQLCADEIHAKLIQTDKDYERSVLSGNTTAWAIPYQDETTLVWCVNVKDRGRKAVKGADISKLKPILKGELVEPEVKPK